MWQVNSYKSLLTTALIRSEASAMRLPRQLLPERKARCLILEG